jgi:hypothetical protein
MPVSSTIAGGWVLDGLHYTCGMSDLKFAFACRVMFYLPLHCKTGSNRVKYAPFQQPLEA